MKKNHITKVSKKKIWLAGHNGLVGRSLLKILKKNNYNVLHKSSKILDLRNKTRVFNFLKKHKPDIIIIAAGKVGGILANQNNPIDFYYDNISIGNNIIKSAYDLRIKNLIYFGSSCIYPNNLKRRIVENDLLTGKLEKTNEYYALAKIGCTKLCQAINKNKNFNYLTVMPCNVYGKYDNFDRNNSHVMASLIRKFIEAKKNKKNSVKIWGTGKPLREFIYVDDLSRAIIKILHKKPAYDIINIGVGDDVSIKNLAQIISKITSFSGKLVFDRSKPDGTYRKLLNNERIKSLGWKAEFNLEKGIQNVVNWYLKNK